MALQVYVEEAFDASSNTELSGYRNDFAKIPGYTGELFVQASTSAVRKSPGDANAALYTRFPWASAQAEVVANVRPLRNSPESPLALVGRSDQWGANIHYRGGWDGASWYLSLMQDGVETILVRAAGETAPPLYAYQDYRLSLQLDNGEIRLLVNNIVILSSTDTTLTGDGEAGFYFGPGTADDFILLDFLLRELGGPIEVHHDLSLLVRKEGRCDLAASIATPVAVSHDLWLFVSIFLGAVDLSLLVRREWTADLRLTVTRAVNSGTDLGLETITELSSQSDLRCRVRTLVDFVADLSVRIESLLIEPHDLRLVVGRTIAIDQDLRLLATSVVQQTIDCQLRVSTQLTTADLSLSVATIEPSHVDILLSVASLQQMSADLSARIRRIFSRSHDLRCAASRSTVQRFDLRVSSWRTLYQRPDLRLVVDGRVPGYCDLLVRVQGPLFAGDLAVRVQTEFERRADLVATVMTDVVNRVDLALAVRGAVSSADLSLRVGTSYVAASDLSVTVASPYATMTDLRLSAVTRVLESADLGSVISTDMVQGQDLRLRVDVYNSLTSISLTVEIKTSLVVRADLSVNLSTETLTVADSALVVRTVLSAIVDIRAAVAARLSVIDLSARVLTQWEVLADLSCSVVNLVAGDGVRILSTRDLPVELPLVAPRGDTPRTALITRYDRNGMPVPLIGLEIDVRGTLADGTAIDLNPYLHRHDASGRLRIVIPLAVAALWPAGLGRYDLTVTDGVVSSWFAGPLGVTD